MALLDTIADPEEAHVHSFGPLLFDGVVGDAGSGGVVGGDGGWSLRVSKLFEGDSFRDGVLSIDEEGAEFGFGSTC